MQQGKIIKIEANIGGRKTYCRNIKRGIKKRRLRVDKKNEIWKANVQLWRSAEMGIKSSISSDLYFTDSLSTLSIFSHLLT